MAGFELEGLDKVLDKMGKMAEKVQKQHAKKALRAAAKIVQDDAKATAKLHDDPETAAEIYKNIVIRPGKTRSKNEVKMRVGVKGGGKFWQQNKNVQRKGKKRQKNPHYTPVENDTRHFWLVEFGTKKTPAFPFMRPALDKNIQNVTDTFADQLQKEIMRDVK